MSIYHLHIPRTSGIYISQNIVPFLISNKIEHFASNRSHIDVEKIKTSKFVSGHFGLMPLDYMQNPEVFAIVRDPVERFISYFNYTTGLIKTQSEAYQKLDYWLYGEQAPIQSNSQSKFLTGYMNVNKFNEGVTQFQKAVYNNWFIENFSLDINSIKANIDQFNVFTMDNHDSFINILNKKLYSEFGFKTFKHNDKYNSSTDIGIKFSKSHIEKIKELNKVDMEMYDYVQTNQKRH